MPKATKDLDANAPTKAGIKYWNEEEQAVISGVARAEDPITLNSLCGTYRWVYNGSSTVNEELGPEDDWGIFKLFREAGKRGTPGNICGTFRMGGLSGEFHGLKVVRSKQEDGTRRAETNLWEIKSVEWEDDDERGEETGNMLAPTETLDDNGNPFIEFLFNEEGIDAHKESYFLKKQDDDEGDEGLTDGERRRLGIGLGRDEVKEQAENDDTEDQEETNSTKGVGEARSGKVEKEKKLGAAKKSSASSTRATEKTKAKTRANAAKGNSKEDEKVQVGKKRKAEDEGEGSGSRFLVKIGDYYEYVSDLFRTHDT